MKRTIEHFAGFKLARFHCDGKIVSVYKYRKGGSSYLLTLNIGDWCSIHIDRRSAKMLLAAMAKQ